MKVLISWLAGSEDHPRLEVALGLATGAVLGLVALNVLWQTQLLENLYILAHEQRRMTMAAAARALAAAKESPHNG